MWPFKKAPLLDATTARWHVDNMVWLIRNLGRTPMFTDTRLVLPSPGFFSTEGQSGHALAQTIFQGVKTFASMADWPVRLVSDVEVYEPDSRYLVQAPSQRTPLGTFTRDHEHGAMISYAPSQLKTPAQLIATFAHELAHYLVHSIEDTLPCAPEEEEFLTDQTACFMGFGVFMANGAFQFEQWRDNGSATQGWQTKRNGYLPESDLVFDLALFLSTKNLPADEALKCLKPHLAGHLKKAIGDVEAYRPELQMAVETAYAY